MHRHLAWATRFLEQALSTSNNVAKGKDELECLNDAVTRLRQGHTSRDVIESLERAQPECSNYVGAIVDVAKKLCESDGNGLE